MGLLSNPKSFKQTFNRTDTKSMKKNIASPDPRIKELEARKADLQRLKSDLDRLNTDLSKAIEEFDMKIENIQSNKI